MSKPNFDRQADIATEASIVALEAACRSVTDAEQLGEVDRLDYSASANRGLGRDGLVTLLTEAAACIREMVEQRDAARSVIKDTCDKAA